MKSFLLTIMLAAVLVQSPIPAMANAPKKMYSNWVLTLWFIPAAAIGWALYEAYLAD